MLRTRRGPSDVSPAEAKATALARENARLKELLAEKAAAGASRSGYLFKYRGHAESSLWANTWEHRYVVLKGNMLTYYKREQDVQYPPRGQIDVQGTVVEPEGLKRRKFWTFNIVDAWGVSLIRLSTESQQDYSRWLDALEQAGCSRRGDEEGRATPSSSLHRLSGSSHVSSPTASGLSDSDTGPGPGPGFFSRHSPEKLPPVGEEVSSHPRRGYTSDASDVGPLRTASFRVRKEGRSHSHRDVMTGSSYVHTAPRYSYLSSERIDFANHQGLLTLLLLVVASTNARLIIENIIKYRLRFNPIAFVRTALTPSGNFLLLLCWPALGLNCLCAYAIELLGVWCLKTEQKAAAAKWKREVGYTELKRRAARQAALTENLLLLLNLLNTTTVLVLPSAVMHYTHSEPLPGFLLSMIMVILWMKLVSYAHVNWDYRHARRKNVLRPGERGSDEIPQDIEDPLQYPENITFRNLAYFLVAPTLCYQPVYPRTKRFRVKWLLRRVAVLIGALGLMLFIIEQYIEPTIENSIGPMQDMDWVRMAERLLKLSLPTLYFWLAMFYVLFHLWLNILAELTTFADREFYKEWWNATTIGEYWRLWNMPVHKWMLRHVYFPCLRHGVSKFTAGIIVFFVSAVFHEVLVGVPLHMLRSWAFVGIMWQVPLIWLTEMLKKKLGNDHIGNMIFWVSFCFVGQPIAIILYYHDYRKLLGLS